jgi:ketosteroid isomerase-like protein
VKPSCAVLGLVSFVAGCAARSPSPPALAAADERAIRAVDSTYVASWLRDDTLAVMNTLAPDALLMPAGQHPLATPNDIRGFWWPRDSSHTRILTFQRTIDEIGGEGNVAWVRGTDTLTYAYDKGTTHSRLGSRSMTLAVWRRQPNGAWRISRMMWGTRLP